jgi:hypothetical protein
MDPRGNLNFPHYRCVYLLYPLLFTIAYRDCTENQPVELYCQIIASPSFELDALGNLEQLIPLGHGFPIHSPEGEFQIHSIPGLFNYSSLLIDYGVNTPVLYGQGAGFKPLILPKPNSVIFPYFPAVSYLCRFCSPGNPSPKGGAGSYITTKEVGKAIIVFVIYNVPP